MVKCARIRTLIKRCFVSADSTDGPEAPIACTAVSSSSFTTAGRVSTSEVAASSFYRWLVAGGEEEWKEEDEGKEEEERKGEEADQVGTYKI